MLAKTRLSPALSCPLRRGIARALQALLLFVLIPLACPDQVFSAGETAGNFLKLGIGAKNAAMGETGATESGINALYWNPAGAAEIAGREVSFMHAAWLEGINFQNFAYAQNIGPGVIGISADFFSSFGMDKYDNTGGRQGTFNASDRTIKLTYASDVSATPEKTLVGVTVKFISSDIEDSSARAVAVDAGAYFDTLFEDLILGVVFQNLGTPLKFYNRANSLPLNLKAGINYLVADGTVVCLDINKAVDTDFIFNAGGEYLLPVGDETGIAFRGGWRSNTKGLGGSAGLTCGFGIIYSAYCFDYAFVPYGDLSDTHRVSISYKF